MTPTRKSPAELTLWALDALEVVLVTPDDREADANARSMLADLDREELLRVAGSLSRVAVHALVASSGRDAARVRARLDRWRVDAMAAAAVARTDA